MADIRQLHRQDQGHHSESIRRRYYLDPLLRSWTPKVNRSLWLAYQEGYGTDAALVLLEPDAPEGIRYLRGIELALLLDDMVDKGLKLTVVLDSCHSGSISRGEDSLVRGILWSVDVDSECPLHVPLLPQSLASKEEIFRDTVTASHWLLHL